MKTQEFDDEEISADKIEQEIMQKEYKPKYKSKFKLLYLLFLLLIIPAVVLPIVLTGGEPDPDPDPDPNPVISVSVSGLKTMYLLNEMVEEVTVTVTVDGEEILEPIVGVNGVDTATTGQKIFVVTYEQKGYEFDYSVVEIDEYDKTVLSLSTNIPSLTFYQNKNAVVPEWAVLTVVLEGGTELEVKFTSDIITVPMSTLTAGNFNFRLEYGGSSLNIPYQILAVLAVEINLTQDQSGKYPFNIYALDGSLDLSRGSLRVLYNTGPEDIEIVPLSDARISITGFDTSVLGDDFSCFVHFGGLSIELFYRVMEIQITSISVDTAFKTQYFLGEVLDVIGGRFRVNYQGGTHKIIDITSAMITGFNSAATGDRQLTIEYGNSLGSIEIYVNYTVVLNEFLKSISYGAVLVGDDMFIDAEYDAIDLTDYFEGYNNYLYAFTADAGNFDETPEIFTGSFWQLDQIATTYIFTLEVFDGSSLLKTYTITVEKI
ncbi:MAG: bacterial Ig-like domain-containing protein [Christensenellaceae bacterium]|nr:bacterial Ig-like domain-containing protein [Christensenellaceae bacterium]